MRFILFFIFVFGIVPFIAGYLGSLVLAAEIGGGVTLINPLEGRNTIMDVIKGVIDGLRDKIAPPIVAIMVLYGGFQMLFAGGVPEKFSKGRNTILYAVVGYAIIFIASGISAIIIDILTSDLFDSYIT